MGRGRCRRHGMAEGCCCLMYSINGYLEPAILLELESRGPSHGYDLWASIERRLPEGFIDKVQVYRALRSLEAESRVTSSWQLGENGPARRVFCLTAQGRERLGSWKLPLARVSEELFRMSREIEQGR